MRWIYRNRAVIPIYVATGVLIISASYLSPTFRDPANVLDILRQSTVLGLVTIAQLFVVLAGGIDMSVGMIARVTGIGAAVAMSTLALNPLIVIPLCLIVGLLLGTANGVLVTSLRAQPFITTIGTMGVLSGVALALSDGPTKMVPASVLGIYDAAIGPIPASVIGMLLLWLVTWWTMRSTRFGRRVYAVGGSPSVSRLAGIDCERTLTFAYAISGLASAAAGIFLVARSGVGNPNMAAGLELQSIVTVAIGGISLYGGRGSAAGAFGAVLFLAVVSNLFDLFQVSGYYQSLAMGLMVVLAVAVQRSERVR